MNNEHKKTYLFNEKGSVLVSQENEGYTKPMKNNVNSRVNPLVWLFKENPYYFAAFFLPVVILFVSYILFGVYPFGEGSVLALDLNGQYIYYFDYIHDVFRGDASLFYSWSRSLSGEFFGILGYYLASPFNFLVWLFPRELITEGILTMLLAKVGAIGVCMAIYLRRGREYSAGTAVVFSMMYALCAFVLVQTMNPMWLDGVLALPLIIYGVESLVKHGRFRLLTIALFYSFVTCFYIGYMLGIFTALYFVCFLISSRMDDTGHGADSGAVMARIGLFAISAATAVLMASFVLIPVLNSLQLGKTGFTEPFEQEGFFGQTNFMLADLARKLFPNSYDHVRNDGLPALYGGMLALILMPLFFFAGKEKTISVKKRAAGAVLALVLILTMYYTPADTVMHGFQVPNWLPYRYSFLLTFLFIVWAAEVFDKLREFSRRAIGISALGIFGFLIYFESRDTFDYALGESGRELFDNATVVIPALLILVVLTIILLCNKNKRFGKTALTVTVGAVVVLELFYNTYASINKQNEDITYSDRATYVDFAVPMREAVNEIRAADDGFYRIEKNFHRTVNDPLALGMYGLSHSASTFNEGAVTLLGRLGLTSRGHYTRYSGATPLVNDLFGVKYIMSHSGYAYGQAIADGVIRITHNETALPIAYLTDSRLAAFSFDDYTTDDVHVFRRQNRLLSAMLGEPRVVEYIRTIGAENIHKSTENVIEGGTTDGHRAYTATGADARVIYDITAEADGDIYMWLPTLYERQVSVLVQLKNEDGTAVRSEWRGSFFEFDDYCIMNLGDFREGDELTVTLYLRRDDLYYRNSFFAYMDAELYGGAIAALHALNAQTTVTKRSETDIRIDVFANTDRLLFTTIPAEPGWTVTVDGKEATPVLVLDSLMGIELTAGTHVIELKFTPAGYPVLALSLTGGGLLIFIILCVLYAKINKERVPPPRDEQLTIDSGQLTIDDDEDSEQLTMDTVDGFDFEEIEEVEEAEEIEEVEEAEENSVFGVPPEPEPELDVILEDVEPITEPEPASFMPKSFFEEEPEAEQEDELLFVPENDEELTVEEEAEEEETIEEEEIIEEEIAEEEAEEIHSELILGSEESFESVAADFAEINTEVEPEPEPEPEEELVADSGQWSIEELNVGSDAYIDLPEIPETEAPPEEPERELETDNGFLLVPEIELVELEAEPPTLDQIDFEARKRALEMEIEPDEQLTVDSGQLTVDDEPEPEPEPEPPPPTLNQIDFAARRRALELEMMNQTQTLEESFSGSIIDAFEEEAEVEEIVPVEAAQPIVSEAEAQPVFTFEEDIEDFLLAGSGSSNMPTDDLFDEPEAEVPSEPEKEPEPTIHTPAPWKDYDNVFEEFEFIMADESEFVGTFEEVAEEEAEEFTHPEPEPEPEPEDSSEPFDKFVPPFGPGTL